MADAALLYIVLSVLDLMHCQRSGQYLLYVSLEAVRLRLWGPFFTQRGGIRINDIWTSTAEASLATVLLKELTSVNVYPPVPRVDIAHGRAQRVTHLRFRFRYWLNGRKTKTPSSMEIVS